MVDAGLRKLVTDLAKTYTPKGATKSAVVFGNDIKPTKIIPAAIPSVGYLTGIGGWPGGKLIELFGAPMSGKSTMACHVMRDAINYELMYGDPSRANVAYLDLEHRFNFVWATKMGLEPNENLIVVQPESAEDGTDAMNDLISSGKICAVTWDSIGGAPTKLSTAKFADKGTMMGGNAQAMKRNVQIMAAKANLFDVACLYLNQVRADMAGWNRPMTPGGNAVEHSMALRIYFRPSNAKEDKRWATIDGKKVQVGHSLVMKTYKNDFSPPYRQQYVDFYYADNEAIDGVGFDIPKDYFRLGLLLGVIEKSGGWYRYGDLQVQGRQGLWDAVVEQGQMAELQEIVQKRYQDMSTAVLSDEFAAPVEEAAFGRTLS